MLKIYNSFSRQKEDFIPIKGNHVGIYACGITPYKPSHLGHAMQAIIFDILRSYLEYKGFDVTYVRNYTDVDDKIINRSNELGVNPLIYVKEMIEKSDKELETLRVKPPTHSPKVTESIPDIIEMVTELISKNMAYVTSLGNVYFKVKNYTNYGNLSLQRIDKLRLNVRKDAEDDKEDPLDFALWKSSKPNEIFWDSPWGKGRPGWHIECSVMSLKYLGEAFEIHGGGVDLIFPHHENEKAQSESIHIDPLTHNGHYAKYWVYNGLLMVDDQKMSKSLQNDISIESMLQKFNPEVIRFMIISNHYRSHVNFVESRYNDANKSVYSIYKTLNRAQLITNIENYDKLLFDEYIDKFHKSMDDDFNTAEIISHIHEFTTLSNETLDKNMSTSKVEYVHIIGSYLKYMSTIGAVLNIFNLTPQIVIEDMENKVLGKQEISRQFIIEQIALRKSLRDQKKYEEADLIRKTLENMHILLSDNLNTTNWSIDF